jgi:hypothetical protein
MTTGAMHLKFLRSGEQEAITTTVGSHTLEQFADIKGKGSWSGSYGWAYLDMMMWVWSIC